MVKNWKFPPKTENNARMLSLLPILLNIILDLLANTMKQEKKSIQILCEEVKLFTEDTVIYLENSREKIMKIKQ